MKKLIIPEGEWKAIPLMPDKLVHHVIVGKFTDKTSIATIDNPNGLVAFADLPEVAQAISALPEMLAATKKALITFNKCKLDNVKQVTIDITDVENLVTLFEKALQKGSVEYTPKNV